MGQAMDCSDTTHLMRLNRAFNHLRRTEEETPYTRKVVAVVVKHALPAARVDAVATGEALNRAHLHAGNMGDVVLDRQVRETESACITQSRGGRPLPDLNHRF